MELSVKINAAIDGFVSAMKAARDSVAGVTDAAKKPITVNADTSSIDAAKTKVSELRSELGKLTQAGQGGSPAAAEIRAQIKALNAEVKEAEQGMKKLEKEVKNVNDTAKNTSGGLSTFAGGLMAGGGLAIAQVGLSAVTSAISGVFDAALEADEIGDKMELAFRQAGLSGKELDSQLESTTQFARKLGDQFAESPAKIKGISTAAASLGGATGKANEDMTKLALGIEKASDGAISGEKAIKLLSRGAANPEDQAALDALSKKFPVLGDAMKSTGDTATKVNASLLALAPTFATLEAQSTGIDAIAARFTNAGTEAIQSFGGGIIGGLDKAGAAIANAAGGLDFEGLYETAANIGEAIGGAISTAVVYILDFYEKVKPIISFIADVLIAQVRIQFGYFQAIIGGAFEIVGQVFDSLRESVQPLIDVLSDLFASTGEGTDYVQEIIDTIKEFVQVIVGVAKVIIEFLVTPIKLFVTEIITVIGWIGKLISNFKGASDGAAGAAAGVEKAKSGFEKFREILQTIQAFLAGVAGGMKGLASDAINLFKALTSFDFSAIKDAFTNFGSGAKQGFTDGWNQKKADIASDGVVAEYEKLIDELDDKSKELTASQLAEQKKLLSGKVAAEKAAGKISLDQEADLQAALAKLGQSAGAAGEKKAAEEKGKALKSLAEEIKKAKQENAKLLSDIDIKAIDDEKARDLKASEEKTANAVQAVKNEVDKVKAEKNVSTAQRLELISILTEKEKILTEQGLQELAAIRGKYALKEFDETKKRYDEAGKREIELAKDNVEALSKIEAVGGSTGGNRIKDLEALNDAKRKLAAAQMEAEVDAAIDTNAKVLAAYDALRKAIERGDKEAQKKLEAAYNNEVFLAEQTDTTVLAIKRKGAAELEKLDKDTREQIAAIRVAGIQDDADRERAERLSAIQKTFDAELLAAAGNERLILDAHRKANAARYDSDEEYNRKTTDLATRTAGVLQGLGMDIATGISEMYGNTFNDLGKAFDDYAAGVQKKMEGTGKEDTAKLEEETKTLRAQLAKREISYKDFQEKIASLRSKEDGGAATATERANLAIGKSFAALGKSATAGVDLSIEEMKKLSKSTAQAIKEKGLSDKNVAKDFEKFGKDIVNIGEGTAESVIGVFGQMAAAGTLTLKSAASAALGITIDTISKIVLAQAPAILAIFTGTIPPPFGFIAGIAAIGAVQLLLATAKGAIGADQGVIGIDGNYSTPRSSRDTIPIWVREGESIINPEATAQNKALLKFINSTNRPASEFFSKSVVTGNGTLQLAHSNQIRTAQLVSVGSGSGGGDMGAMQNSLSNIERSLATAKIIETKSKHTSAVQLSVTENRAFRVQQEKAALKLERARR